MGDGILLVVCLHSHMVRRWHELAANERLRACDRRGEWHHRRLEIEAGQQFRECLYWLESWRWDAGVPAGS